MGLIWEVIVTFENSLDTTEVTKGLRYKSQSFTTRAEVETWVDFFDYNENLELIAYTVTRKNITE